MTTSLDGCVMQKYFHTHTSFSYRWTLNLNQGRHADAFRTDRARVPFLTASRWPACRWRHGARSGWNVQVAGQSIFDINFNSARSSEHSRERRLTLELYRIWEDQCRHGGNAPIRCYYVVLRFVSYQYLISTVARDSARITVFLVLFPSKRLKSG